MPGTPAEIPEGLELRKDGTIVIHLDDEQGRNERITLRRPKMRELRQLREDEWEIASQVRSFMEPLQDAVDSFLHDREIDPTVAGSLASMSTSDLRTLRDLQRDRDQKSQLFSEEQRGPWALQVIEQLGGKRLEEDELPPWCFTADFSGHLLAHWLAVPTRRGSP